MKASAIFLLLLAPLPGAAFADVFEIGRDGAMHTRGGVSIADPGDDASPIDQADESDIGVGVDVPEGALTVVDMPDAPATYRAALLAASARYGVSPSLLSALVWHESRWQPAALSNKGAIGLGQLMPGTARTLAVDPRDPEANLSGAAHYLRQMLDLFDGNVEQALAAYNAGPARVLRANGIPAIPETRTYVSAIIDRLAANRPAGPSGALR